MSENCLPTPDQILFKLKKTIAEDINHDIRSQQLYDRILPLIKLHEGKTIGKRFSDAAKQWLYDFPWTTVTKEYSWHSLKFKDPNSERQFDFSLGYTNQISEAEFKRCNTWAQESEHHRIEENRAFMATGTLHLLASNIYQYQQALHFFESLDFPAKTSCMLKIKEEN